MKTFKKIGKALLFPHKAVLIPLVPLSAALLIYSLGFPDTEERIKYPAYAVSAYTLTALCCRLPSCVRFFRHIKTENRYLARYFSDTHLRVSISLYGSVAINTIYAFFQMALGIYHGSLWFYSMAAYYLILAVMRFFLLHYTRTHKPGLDRLAELCWYRFCGGALMIMNLALAVIVFYITWQNRTFHHHQITTIAMAAYTFTAFTMAIVNMVKYRRYKSPVYSAAKAVSFASAMVSMLTLETAMLTAFSETGQENFRQWMTGCSGAAVTLTIFILAVFMIVKSSKELKLLKGKSPQL